MHSTTHNHDSSTIPVRHWEQWATWIVAGLLVATLTLFLGIGVGSGMNAGRAHSTATHAVEEMSEHVADDHYTPHYVTQPLWNAIVASHTRGDGIPSRISTTHSDARWDWPTLSTKTATVSGTLTLSNGTEKPYTAVIVQQHNGRWVMTSLHVGEQS